jgi:hypothetical protein
MKPQTGMPLTMAMTMSKDFLKIVLLTILLLPVSIVAADEEVKAGVAISVQQDQDYWAGQQVTLNLDLKTTGFSFSGSHFNLPEVPGAFLMQTDTTTMKMTENIDGQTWQIIRYPLALYPQKAGQLEIPSIAVRFSTSAGFGSTSIPFEFQTKPLDLTINSPPGVKDGDLVITTRSFELDYEWQPESGTAQTGAAFTLTVKRRAVDISAMLLPPLPVFRIEGLAAYPQAPEVNDKTNRGDLSGERTDTIIWVVEKPGTYDIPGIRFQWWDPDSRELKQQIIPGLTLDILPAAGDKVTAETTDKPGQSGKDYFWLLGVLITVITAVFLFLRFGRKAPGPAEDTEKSTFSTLQKACSSNNPGQAHSALHAWIAQSSPGFSSNSLPVTLSEFARACDDTQLAAESERLQVALISADSTWQGSELLNSLHRIRRKIYKQKTVQSRTHLAPLNPSRT